MPGTARPGPELIYQLRRVTERTAVAAFDWIGRGRSQEGDRSCVDAMRAALMDMDIDGVIVMGENGKHDAPQAAPHMASGERVGRPGATFKADVAVDPVEGTSYLARGLTNALAVMAVAPSGAMIDLAPAFYMEKFAAPAAAAGRIDPEWPVARKLAELATCLGKEVSALTVFVLEKPRHRALVRAIHEAGARVALYPAGDVAGALMAAMPESGIDALMGTGGMPEGVMSACAIRGMGGAFLARIDPQLQTERQAVAMAGLDTGRWYGLDELVVSDEVYFCATGITTGLMLDGVERIGDMLRTQTLMIAGASGGRQVLTSFLSPEGH